MAQGLHNADVVNDEPVALALAHAVGASDGLHKAMGLQRLVKVHGREGLDVKAGEPHGTDKDNA